MFSTTYLSFEVVQWQPCNTLETTAWHSRVVRTFIAGLFISGGPGLLQQTYRSLERVDGRSPVCGQNDWPGNQWSLGRHSLFRSNAFSHPGAAGAVESHHYIKIRG